MDWKIEYYTNINGTSPIKKFIDNLPIEVKARTFKTFELLETYGTQIGYPHVKSVSGIKKLWELRIKAKGNIFRFFFTVKRGRIILLLHVFQKKSDNIPKKELKITINRMKEIL